MYILKIGKMARDLARTNTKEKFKIYYLQFETNKQ